MNSQDLTELKKHPRVLDLYKNRLRLKKEGRRFRGLCPFHDDRTANNFDVFLNDGTYIHKCLSCGASGSIIDLIQKTDSVDLKGALVIIKEFCSVRGQEKEEVEQIFDRKGNKPSYMSMSLADYVPFENALANCPVAKSWLLHERGISYETAKQLHFGYVQDIGKRAGENNPMSNKGWLVFPSINGNRVVDLKYRSIVAKKTKFEDEQYPGFCKQGGMVKGQDAVLHGLESIDIFEPVLVTEGELDRAVLEQANFHSVSVPNGAESSISPAMMDRLLTAEYVILAGDTDEKGLKLMTKLWSQLGEKTYLLTWPAPHKDANQFFLSGCERDVEKFQKEVAQLIEIAKSRPMQGVYNIQQSLATTQHQQLTDHPDRLTLPWKSVNDMTLLMPGTLTTVYSTESGMGKSTFMIQASIHIARENKKTVLNYQAEMSPMQLDTMFASHILQKNRLHLQNEDYRHAAQLLGNDFKYYIGRDTSLTTIGEVLDLIEKAVRRFGAEVVILDNLHFLCRNEVDQVKAQENALQRITNFAAKYNLYFFLVHQARKADQNHKRKVPHITDISGGKAIQNDSTTIFNIHREEVKQEDGQENEYSPVTEIRLQKARDKDEGTAYTKLMFRGKVCTFSDMTLVEAPQIAESAEAGSIF